MVIITCFYTTPVVERALISWKHVGRLYIYELMRAVI